MPKPYVVQDKFFHKAKEQNLRARSAFKLDEIQQKFHLVKPGHCVADLGAAPGSWSQRLSQWVGPQGVVFALDQQEIEPLGKNVKIFQLDLTDRVLLEHLGLTRVDGVVADLAPKTTGVHDADAYHSAELNHVVLDFCLDHLKPGGYVVTKIFQGEEFNEVLNRIKKLFSKVKCHKPEASRDRSRETYIVGQHFTGAKPPSVRRA